VIASAYDVPFAIGHVRRAVLDEECAFIVRSLFVNPELILRYVSIPVMLAEVRKLLV